MMAAALKDFALTRVHGSWWSTKLLVVDKAVVGT